MEMCFIHLRIVISTLLCRCAVNAEGMLVVDTRLQENHHKIQFTLRHHTRVVAPEFPTKNTSDTLEPLHSNSKKCTFDVSNCSSTCFMLRSQQFIQLISTLSFFIYVVRSTCHIAHVNIVFFHCNGSRTCMCYAQSTFVFPSPHHGPRDASLRPSLVLAAWLYKNDWHCKKTQLDQPSASKECV